MKSKSFVLLFILLLAAECILGFFPKETEMLHLFTKPALLILLNIFFFVQTKSIPDKRKIWVQLALVFSLAGDVFLLFQAEKPIFFLLGLGAFLIGHLGYIVAFFKASNLVGIDWKKKLLWIGLLDLLLIGGVIFTLIENNLNDLLVPVIVYMLVILTMGFSSLTRVGRVSQKSFRWVAIGAVLFIISDGVLALNKFHMPLPASHVWIMLPYGLAQLCIVIGMIEQFKNPLKAQN